MKNTTSGSKIRVLIGDDSAEFGVICANDLHSPSLFVFTRKKDGYVILNAISRDNPDVVIMETVMPGLDAVAVLEKTRSWKNRPIFIVVSSFGSNSMENQAIQNGASYFAIRPFDAESMRNRIIELVREKRLGCMQVKCNSIEMRVTQMLQKIGVSAHLNGYHYLRTGILIAIQDPTVLNNMMLRLYPSIAEIHKTMATRVERSIRHALTVTWQQGNMDVIQSVFGCHSSVYEKPSNSEFIALLADILRIEKKSNT